MDRIKFAIFTDLHYDHIPDGRQRIENFITNAREADVDFVIELGDFCSPKESISYFYILLYIQMRFF
jgi:predicted phosphodiesterase